MRATLSREITGKRLANRDASVSKGKKNAVLTISTTSQSLAVSSGIDEPRDTPQRARSMREQTGRPVQTEPPSLLSAVVISPGWCGGSTLALAIAHMSQTNAVADDSRRAIGAMQEAHSVAAPTLAGTRESATIQQCKDDIRRLLLRVRVTDLEVEDYLRELAGRFGDVSAAHDEVLTFRTYVKVQLLRQARSIELLLERMSSLDISHRDNASTACDTTVGNDRTLYEFR